MDCPELVKLLHTYPNVKVAGHGRDHYMDGVRYTVVEDHTLFTYQVNASQNPVLNSDRVG